MQSDLLLQFYLRSDCTKSKMQVFSTSDFWKFDFWESSGNHYPCTTAYSACHWLIKRGGKKILVAVKEAFW